jgi:ParB/RepB/Spo0J family partition protein
MQPITVRRNPRNEIASFDIVCGHRRYAAARLNAGADLGVTLPCLVRELTDRQVLELQITENLQREDVHPLEEAEGYERLMREHGYTADQVAEKIGKSRRYVFNTLKLRSLAVKGRDAMYRNELTRSHALEIAKIPSLSQQEEALAWTLRAQPSVADLRAHIERDYMQRLEGAPFDLDDATLAPEAGSCAACPKRTINQAELFGTGADRCTDGACFRHKITLHFTRLRTRAEEQGFRIIEGEEADRLFWFPFDGGAPDAQAGDEPAAWVALDAAADDEYVDAEDNGAPIPSWRELLQAEGAERKVKTRAYVQAPEGRGSKAAGKLWELGQWSEVEKALAPVRKRVEKALREARALEAANDAARRAQEAKAAQTGQGADGKPLTAAEKKRALEEQRCAVERRRDELLAERAIAALHAATANGLTHEDFVDIALGCISGWPCGELYGDDGLRDRWGFRDRVQHLAADTLRTELARLDPASLGRATLELIVHTHLDDEAEIAATILARHGIDLQALRDEIEVELPLPGEGE